VGNDGRRPTADRREERRPWERRPTADRRPLWGTAAVGTTADGRPPTAVGTTAGAAAAD